ncbi:MAG: F420-0:Gamma-glutamyl ligase, partial [Prochlorococcaceae cyanobacterium]
MLILLLLRLVLIAALLFGLLLLLLELRHRLRPASPLRLSAAPFAVEPLSGGGLRVSGEITISNPHRRMEVFVPELELRPTLLGRGDLAGVTLRTAVTALHPDEEERPDGYWAAYIVKGRKSTHARLTVDIRGGAGVDLPALLDTLWLEVLWVNYGPFGRLQQRDGILIPLRHPQPQQAATASWRSGERCRVLPVRTHLLGTLDDPERVLRHYAGGVLQSGDVLTIGETPLAVIQGRYHHPQTVRPSALARLLCRVFHPTSSLATACGMQTLIDLVGPARVASSAARTRATIPRLVGASGCGKRSEAL